MKIFRLAMLAACVGALVAPNFAAAESSGSTSGSPLLKALAPKAKERKPRAVYFNPFNAASRSRLATTRLGTPLLSVGSVGGALSTATPASQTVFRLAAPAAKSVVAGPAPVVVATPTALPTAAVDLGEVPTVGGSSSDGSSILTPRPPFRPPVRSPFRPPPRPPF